MFCLHAYVCTTCVPGVWGGQKGGIRFPGTAVTDSCKLLCGCWEPNLGLLESQQCS